MKKYEVILKDGTIGIYTSKSKPKEGQTVTVYCGNGISVQGIVYDVIR